MQHCITQLMLLCYNKISIKSNKYKCISKTHIRQIWRVQLKLCATPRPLFKGNISVADSMLLSSLLKTIKINSGVQCRRCKKSRFWTNIRSITAESNVLSTLGWYASDSVDQRRMIHALQHFSGDVVYHTCCRKYLKTATYFCSWWTPLGGYCHVTEICRKLSSSWC